MIKNSTNQHISFLMLSAADGSGVTTGTTFVAICKDGGGPVTATNSPVHKSNGAWTLDLSQAETNCDHLLAVMTISGAITAMVQVYPVDPATFKADVSALATATDISDIKGATWSASTDTLELIRDRVDFGINLTLGQNDFDPANDTVANVGTVQTCVSNSDMRGTDGANTVAPDNVGITSNGVAIAALNDFDPATDTVVNVANVAVCASNTDMRGTDGANTVAPDNTGIAANGTAISNLNDINATDVENAVWDASLSSHNAGGTTGKSLKQIKEGTITIESSINDTAATTTAFVTSLTEPTTSYYSNKIMVFTSGNLSGQARIITDYNGTTKTITLEEPLTSAPADGDQFLILATHENSIEEIQNGLAKTTDLATVTKTGVQYTATAQSGDTIQVTLS
jgi:hypothetical protein